MLLSEEEKDSRLKLAQLHRAFEDDLDVKLVEKILESRGDINYQVSYSYFRGYTALHFARTCSEAKELKVVQLLLKYGADFTIKSAKGRTALHRVLEKLEYGMIKYNTFWGLKDKLSVGSADAILTAHVQKSITKNPANEYSLTHFHMACMADHAAAAQFFLDNGVPINLTVDEDAKLFPGCTPFFIAAKSCALEVIKVLLRYGANPHEKDEEGMSVFYWLIDCNVKILDSLIVEHVDVKREAWLSKLKINQTVVDLLFSHDKIDRPLFVDEIGLSDLHIACTLEKESVVQQLLIQERPLDHQVEENSELWPGYTAMHFAAYFNLESMKLLLSMGAELLIKNADGLTSFDICLERYAIKDIHFIMSTQPNLNDITLLDGKTKLLDLVSAMQNINQFRLFLDQHVGDINTSISKDSPLWPGYTVLHLAVLLSEQLNKNSDYSTHKVTQHDMTCDVVKFIPNLDLVEECLTRGADVTVADVLGSTPLHLAFYNRQSLTIEKLLQFHHSTVNPVDKHNLSHLHIACASQDTNVMKALLKSGANIEERVHSDFQFYRRQSDSSWLQVEPIPAGSTCLHIAVAGRSTDVVELLVEMGADVNAVDDFGATPIHCFLVQRPHCLEDTISDILFSSTNLKEVIAGDTGITHLHVASYLFDDKAVERLLDLGANIEARLGSQSALDEFRDRYNNGELSPLDFECYAELTPLQVHMMAGPTHVANVLIKRGADFLTKPPHGRNPLNSLISFNEDTNCVKVLLQVFIENEALAKRVEEEYGLTTLHLASSIPDLEIVEKLIADGANVNAQLNKEALSRSGYTPLHMLIKMSRDCIFCVGNCLASTSSRDKHFVRNVLEPIRALLAAGADVSLCNSSGDSSLHLITNYLSKQEEFEALLLNLMLDSIKDFHFNPAGKLGWSHFHIACFLNNSVVIEEFLKHGVDVNAPLNYFNSQEAGCSALHLLVRKPYRNMAPLKVETIDILLEHGADVNAQNADGDTVLHRIARFASDRCDIVQKLISAGADLNKLNKACETPFTTLLLMKEATAEMIGLFIENGCLVNDFNAAHQRGCLSLPLCVSDSVIRDRGNIIQALFKSSDITKTDATGRTAIHNIVSADGFDISNDISVGEYSRMIRELCRKGCDIDSQDQSGRTALHIATQFKNYKAIKALLMNGADVNVFDNSGSTAFNYSFDYCECKKSKRKHRHSNVVKTFYVFFKKLLHLGLHINKFNRNILMSNLTSDFNENEMEKFYSELNGVNDFKFEQDSNSFSLKDLLSETGIVAVYPQKALVRVLVDKVYQRIDISLKDYKEVIGFAKLQFRKAVNRVALVDPAAESLNCLVGFPFPETCRQVVLRCLSNADLENLILSTKSA